MPKELMKLTSKGSDKCHRFRTPFKPTHSAIYSGIIPSPKTLPNLPSRQNLRPALLNPLRNRFPQKPSTIPTLKKKIPNTISKTLITRITKNKMKKTHKSLA